MMAASHAMRKSCESRSISARNLFISEFRTPEGDNLLNLSSHSRSQISAAIDTHAPLHAQHVVNLSEGCILLCRKLEVRTRKPGCPDQAISDVRPESRSRTLLRRAMRPLIYRLSPLRPLAKDPRPAIAKTSKLWAAYHCAKGDMHRYYNSLHDRCGDVVRVGRCRRCLARIPDTRLLPV
ncbi:hypothetical protein EDB84DRAFT_1223082 [Lactarius hengduanensis]|nr:hypothetical protein EDB84DRAFT_1223082 [Lactarius hengduanensis]